MSFQPLDPPLTISRSKVFVAKNGVQTPCATALMTLMALHGKPDRPGEDSDRRGQKV